MKCTVTDLAAEATCSWCNKKSECLTTSLEGTFFQQSNLCLKCFKTAIDLRKRQETMATQKKQQAPRPIDAASQ
jgi:hypothetical protein